MKWNKISNGIPENAIVDIWVVTGRGGFRVADVTWCKDDNIFADDFGSEYDLTEVTHWRYGNDEPDE